MDRQKPLVFGGVAATALLGATMGLANAATFQGLGVLPGYEYSRATDISADGKKAVGAVGRTDPFAEKAFLWSEESGMKELGGLPGSVNNWANAISADGSTVVGTTSMSENHPDQAFRWTNGGGMQRLGDPEKRTSANAVSGDGKVIVGSVYTTAEGVSSELYRWSESGGFEILGDSRAPFGKEATGVSADGNTIIGYVISHEGPFGFVDAPEGRYSLDIFNRPRAISGDGSVVVGSDVVAPFRWTRDTGLRFLTEERTPGIAFAISGDGTVIVGQNLSEPFIWTAKSGMIDIKSRLADEGVDISGWDLQTAVGVSDDGTTIIGNGLNPDGVREAWIATISPVPEVEVWALMIVGFSVLAWQSKRERPKTNYA